MLASQSSNKSVIGSPDSDAVLGLEKQRVARLDVERRIPLVHVADDPVDPELGRAVDVREQSVALGFGPADLLQLAAKAMKKRWSPVRPSMTGASFRRGTACRRRKRCAVQIGNVLAECQLPVDAIAR